LLRGPGSFIHVRPHCSLGPQTCHRQILRICPAPSLHRLNPPCSRNVVLALDQWKLADTVRAAERLRECACCVGCMVVLDAGRWV
jgi:hypothetical protein